MQKTWIILIAAVILSVPAMGFGADAPVPELAVQNLEKLQQLPSARAATGDPDRITPEKALSFLAMVTSTGMEEMNDNSLETMVCTPHALPRKLFFQALCSCATDPDTKVSDLEILALNEEMDRSGEDKDAALTLRDVDESVTSAGYFMTPSAVSINTCSYPSINRQALTNGTIPDGWAASVMRSQAASF